ncbi:hypothetical protein QAD02_021714 [Eretmocerus hayati]|uniref:Uncharacterized protein n=1 Tax=Eretmocerus hayati TaxID=131215 RepID=A0ACC2PSK2_9HYME|nr:hypothetical protein QAD02_021714 [Eretmocerus hayati]
MLHERRPWIPNSANAASGDTGGWKLKERYDLAVSIAGMFLDTAELALLEWGLSLRIYSTKVEMYRQMARSKMMSRSNCDNFVDTGGEVACSLEELKQHLSRDTWRTVDTYNIDHFYLRKKSANRTVVFYGDICSDSFSDFHDELKSKAENDEINYVLRHHVRLDLRFSPLKTALRNYSFSVVYRPGDENEADVMSRNPISKGSDLALGSHLAELYRIAGEGKEEEGESEAKHGKAQVLIVIRGEKREARKLEEQ